jgi:hypothetical protein
MRSIKFTATVLLTLCSFLLHSQKVLNIYVADHFKKPLAHVIVKHEGLVSISDEAGFLRLTNYVTGSKIEIHKLGFADTILSLASGFLKQDTLNINISLRLKVAFLPEILVNSAVMQEINPMRSDFVIAYELTGNQLIELLSDDIVLLIDEGEKMKYRSRPVSGTKDLVKDPDGNLHITTAKNAHRLVADSMGLAIHPLPEDLDKLNWNVRYCDESNGHSRFIRRYRDNNQTVAFFAVNVISKRVKLLKEISDAGRSKAVQAFANETNSLLSYLSGLEESNPGGVMGDISGAELELYRKAEQMAGFLEKNYVLPSYSFLKLIKDSIYLFAHDIDSMFVYDREWKLVKSTRINYHHLKIWGKELIANEEKTKVYAKLIKDSKTMIAEIDLQTGALKSPAFTIGFPNPKRLRIRANAVYFMARQQNDGGYSVYYQNLPSSP